MKTLNKILGNASFLIMIACSLNAESIKDLSLVVVFGVTSILILCGRHYDL